MTLSKCVCHYVLVCSESEGVRVCLRDVCVCVCVLCVRVSAQG